MSKRYYVPAATTEAALEVKKSRFIARAVCVHDRPQAMAAVDQAKVDYPDARHHCWAYVLGNPTSTASAAMNDAGEPSGTAGRPILNVIQHKGIGDVIVVVIRYFGGIKLGAGGLTRAYSGAAQAVLQETPLDSVEPMLSLVLEMGFDQEQLLRHWAQVNGAEVGRVDYRERVTMVLTLGDEGLEALRCFCAAQGVLLQEG